MERAVSTPVEEALPNIKPDEPNIKSCRLIPSGPQQRTDVPWEIGR